MENIAIIGSSGAIGSAFKDLCSELYPKAEIFAFSSQKQDGFFDNVRYYNIDYFEESSICESSSIASEKNPLDMVIVSTGILHEEEMMPEKSLKQISSAGFYRLFEANTILPALVAKHFVPKLNTKTHSVFAALSAKSGSISENKTGGWYSYRSSKAALNMIIKNVAIETARINKNAIIIALDPGIVDSKLSKPFHNIIPINKITKPKDSVRKILKVVEKLQFKNSGQFFSYDGRLINP